MLSTIPRHQYIVDTSFTVSKALYLYTDNHAKLLCLFFSTASVIGDSLSVENRLLNLLLIVLTGIVLLIFFSRFAYFSNYIRQSWSDNIILRIILVAPNRKSFMLRHEMCSTYLIIIDYNIASLELSERSWEYNISLFEIIIKWSHSKNVTQFILPPVTRHTDSIKPYVINLSVPNQNDKWLYLNNPVFPLPINMSTLIQCWKRHWTSIFRIVLKFYILQIY